MNKNYNYTDERCIPDSILYEYKLSLIKDAEKLKDIEQHLNECESCRLRLNTIVEDVEKDLKEFNELKKTIRVPEYIKSNIKEYKKITENKKHEKESLLHKPQRGDIYTARGKEYFWQQSKLVLIINYIKDEDVYYVVPLDDITFYATDLDVIIKDKNGVVYIADATADNNLFANQLKKKVGEVHENHINNISKMILYVAGKDVDISDIPKGLPVESEDDQRIPFIVAREKALQQLFKPYMEFVESQIHALEEEELEPEPLPEPIPWPHESVPKRNPAPIQEPFPVIEIDFSLYNTLAAASASGLLPLTFLGVVSGFGSILSSIKNTFIIKKNKKAFIGIQKRGKNIFLIYKGVDLIECEKYNKWNKGKRNEGKILLGSEEKILPGNPLKIQIHYKIGKSDERRIIIIK